MITEAKLLWRLVMSFRGARRLWRARPLRSTGPIGALVLVAHNIRVEQAYWRACSALARHAVRAATRSSRRASPPLVFAPSAETPDVPLPRRLQLAFPLPPGRLAVSDPHVFWAIRPSTHSRLAAESEVRLARLADRVSARRWPELEQRDQCRRWAGHSAFFIVAPRKGA